MSKLYISGIKKDSSEEEIKNVIRSVFIKATDDINWLNKGDLVLLKPALNSPDPYPATTDPLAVEAVAELIEERGGQVVVGDQSGVEYVVHTPKGVLKGDSEKNFVDSGMGKLGKYKFVSFEKEGWNEGFFNFKSEKTSSWPNGFYVTNWIKKADHIINLPRLSTHIQAGTTLGFKNFVGLLREDIRMEFHADGPMFYGIKMFVSKYGLNANYKNQNKFWDKITEISLAAQNKTRLTLVSGRKAQVTFGPDKKVIGIFKAKEAYPEIGFIFASANPIAAEAAGIAILTHLYNQIPLRNKILHKIALKFNGQARELGKQSVWGNPCIKRALELGIGERDFEVEFENVEEASKSALKEILCH